MLSLLLVLAPVLDPAIATAALPANAPASAPVPAAAPATLDTVHGYSATSPNGELELQVRPADRDGEGGATYTLLDDGDERWSVRFDFTLRGAYVTDAGFAGGYAETDFEDVPGREDGDHVGVVVLEDGAVIAEDWREVWRAPWTPSSGWNSEELTRRPDVEGLIALHAAGRFVLHIEVGDADESAYEAYDMETGERVTIGSAFGAADVAPGEDGAAGELEPWVRYAMLPAVSPELAPAFERGGAASEFATHHGDPFENGDDLYEELVEVHGVPGTDLLLERWVVSASKDAPRSEVLNLIDAQGFCIYRRYTRHAYAPAPTDDDFDPALVERIEMAADAPRFDVLEWLPNGASLYRATYTIALEHEGWLDKRLAGVRIERTSRVVTERDPTSVVRELSLELIASVEAPEAFPTILDRIGEAELEDLASMFEVGFFQGTHAWQVLANGDILVVRTSQDGGVESVRYDAEFNELGRVPLEGLELEEPEALPFLHADLVHSSWAVVADGQWLCVPGGARDSENCAGTKWVDGIAGVVRDFDLEALVLAVDPTLPATTPEADFEMQPFPQPETPDIRLDAALPLPDRGILLELKAWGSDFLLAVEVHAERAGEDWVVPRWSVREDDPQADPLGWTAVDTLADGRVVGISARSNQLWTWSSGGRAIEEYWLPETYPGTDTELSLRAVHVWEGSRVLLTSGRSLETVPGGAYVFDLDSGEGALVQLAESSPLPTAGAHDFRHPGVRPGRMVRMASGENWLLDNNQLGRLGATGDIAEWRVHRSQGPLAPITYGISEGGRCAVFDGLTARLWVWDVATGEVIEVEGPNGGGGFGFGWFDSLSFGPDGRIKVRGRGLGMRSIFRGLWPTSPELNWTPGSEHFDVRYLEEAEFEIWGTGLVWAFTEDDVFEVRDASGAVLREVAMHDGGKWFEVLLDVAVAPDGTVSVMDMGTHLVHRTDFTPEGEELRSVLTATVPLGSTAHPKGGPVPVLHDGPLALARDLLTDRPEIFPLVDLPLGPAVIPAHAPDELWVFEAETHTLHRYRIPAELVE